MSEVDYSAFAPDRLNQIRARYQFENRIEEIINILEADEGKIKELGNVIRNYYLIDEVNAVPVSHWVPPGCDLDRLFTDWKELVKFVSEPRIFREHARKRAKSHAAVCPNCGGCPFQNSCTLPSFARMAKDLQEKDAVRLTERTNTSEE